MKIIRLLKIPSTLLLIVLMLTGCAGEASRNTDQPKPPEEKTEDRQKDEIKQTLVEMWDAIEKGDIDRYATYIHPDFTQWGETAKTLRIGKADEVKAIKDWIEEPTKVATKMKEPRVTLRGDTAWITYIWEDAGTSKGEPFATRGKSTRIFVKENNRWLCIHGHYTLLEQ